MNQNKVLRILYITFSPIDTNTSATLRNMALIKGLVKNNSIIDLLTLTAIDSINYYDNMVNKLENVNIISLPQNKAYSSLIEIDNNLKGKIKKAILPYLRKIYHSFNLFDNTIYVATKVDINKIPSDYYDIVISSSDPKSSHIAAEKLISSGLKYGKWIQYWGDPLTIDITNRSIHPKWYIKKIEENIISKSDIIVYVSPFTLAKQKKMFPNDSHKMTFIPTPYLQPRFFENNKKKNSQNLTLGYFGDYKTTIRDIGPIYRYAKNSGHRLIIAGNSDVELMPTKNIIIYPRITQKEITKLEEESDILVCILNKKGTQIPGKIYHYGATNKPVLILLDGDYKSEISDYLSSFNRYILCENKESAIGDALNKVTQQKKHWEPSPHFSPESIGQQFINLL